MKIEIFYIALGLFLGFFIIYITTPAPRIVLKYPTIENIRDTTYVDQNGMCYKYYAIETPCPVNSQQPAQYANNNNNNNQQIQYATNNQQPIQYVTNNQQPIPYANNNQQPQPVQYI